MPDTEMVELGSLHCIKLRRNISPPASGYVATPGRSQGCRMGLLPGRKAAVKGDKAEEGAVADKDTPSHHGAWLQGKSRFLPMHTASSSEQCSMAQGDKKDSGPPAL